jgi:hypothetical protein
MRCVFLVPDLDLSQAWHVWENFVFNSRLKPLEDWTRLRMMRISEVPGGALNIMRHCAIARSCGVDAVLATMRGIDSYGSKGIPDLPFIRWADRKPDDICIVPDYVTELMDEVKGLAIAYLQVPIHTHNNFNYKDSRFRLWTDSIYMQRICERTYPGKEIEIVPNIIDNNAFKFIPQDQREAGVLFAFPRKGPEFIDETEKRYQEMGGTYWKFERINGLSIHELAKQFQRPQVFLASAPIEGCALPPQESMASGIVVVGRTASGANFCMEHRKTAMVAETPQQAAECLIELDNSELRTTLAQNAYQYISRYFPTEEPKKFWQETIRQY